MTRDRVPLGPAPAEEECAQVGSDDYADRSLRECRRYVEAIRIVCGEPPAGATLRIVSQPHDFGSYREVVCEFNGTDEVAATYANFCDERAPKTWAEAGLEAPASVGRGPLKRYVGERTADGCEVRVIDASHPGGGYPLPPRGDLRNHSPDGFNWGYVGSGPAQLALALLADALGDDERAGRAYQDVKFKVIARLEGDRFELTEDDLRHAVEAVEAERGRRR